MNEYTDIMKNLFLPVLLVAGSFFVSCTSSVFTPTPSANPWDDNYLSVAKMEDYRQWGTYNVHDPSCRKLGDYYYMYSTDAIFGENRKEAREKGVPLGFIQMRRSKDLVHWEFLGWAFPEIPEEAVQWVQSHAGELELYDPETGEVLNPADFTDKDGNPLVLSPATVANRTGNRRSRRI